MPRPELLETLKERFKEQGEMVGDSRYQELAGLMRIAAELCEDLDVPSSIFDNLPNRNEESTIETETRETPLIQLQLLQLLHAYFQTNTPDTANIDYIAILLREGLRDYISPDTLLRDLVIPSIVRQQRFRTPHIVSALVAGIPTEFKVGYATGLNRLCGFRSDIILELSRNPEYLNYIRGSSANDEYWTKRLEAYNTRTVGWIRQNRNNVALPDYKGRVFKGKWAEFFINMLSEPAVEMVS